MELLVTASLILNIAVLTPVCVGLLLDANWTRQAYGEKSPACGILLSVYLSIGFVSCLLLIKPLPPAVAALLAVQIIYKLTVRSVRNPVVISNLIIAGFHGVTLAAIWQAT